jgi:dTDP-4-amino-4,6-dideoxygalactose transaminase
MKVFKGRMKVSGSLSESEKACSEVLSLPIEPLQEKSTTSYIIDRIKDFYGE